METNTKTSPLTSLNTSMLCSLDGDFSLTSNEWGDCLPSSIPSLKVGSVGFVCSLLWIPLCFISCPAWHAFYSFRTWFYSKMEIGGLVPPHPTPRYIYRMNPTKLVVRVDVAISRKDHDPQIMEGQGSYTNQLSPRLPVRIIRKIISVGPASASEGVHGFENVHWRQHCDKWYNIWHSAEVIRTVPIAERASMRLSRMHIHHLWAALFNFLARPSVGHLWWIYKCMARCLN
jgi:hypothetical protein